jgi:iron complex transport system substrate-binding protein
MSHRLAAPVLTVLLAATLAGCASTASSAPPTATADAPVTVSNCGVEVTFDAAPQRVVTIKSTSTEMLLGLGVGDRIVATAFQDGPLPKEWASTKIPVLSPQMPSEAAVLNLEPDLVYSGWESAFTPQAAGDRAELASLGVNGYVQPAACRSAQQPGKLDFTEVFREIQEAADIFRVDAAPLLDKQRATLEAIKPDGRGLSALWYSSGTDVPYVGAGIGAPQLLLDTVGLSNIAGGIAQTWSPFSWEAVIDANPDVIVLIDADWNTAESKKAMLESNPATAQLDAVVHHRYLVLPFAASEAGVRSVSAAASLADQLKKLDLP